MIISITIAIMSKIIFRNVENMRNLACACTGNAQQNSMPKLMGVLNLKSEKQEVDSHNFNILVRACV